jgi:acetate kinase
VFTGGIGEHDGATRSEALAGLGGLGIVLDEGVDLKKAKGLRVVSGGDSRTAVYVVPAEEDRMIAWHVGEMAG